MSVVGLLGLLTYLNWRLTLITFIILPVVAVCIQTVSKRLRKLSANNQIYLGQLMQVLGESINGERVVKIYGGQDYENRRFNRIADDVRRNLLKQVSASSAGTGTYAIDGFGCTGRDYLRSGSSSRAFRL